MPTSRVLTPINPTVRDTDRSLAAGPVRGSAVLPRPSTASGFTLVEMVVVMVFLMLFVLMAQLNLFGVLQRNRFKSQIQDFIGTMQLAAGGAAETSRRFEVILNISEQTYLLREISSSNLAEVLDEEIIEDGAFGDRCRISYVEFDDGDYENEGLAKFRVGHAGWNYGGKVVFLDESDQKHTVLITRLSPIVKLVQGDPEMVTPKARDDIGSL